MAGAQCLQGTKYFVPSLVLTLVRLPVALIDHKPIFNDNARDQIMNIYFNVLGRQFNVFMMPKRNVNHDQERS